MPTSFWKSNSFLGTNVPGFSAFFDSFHNVWSVFSRGWNQRNNTHHRNAPNEEQNTKFFFSLKKSNTVARKISAQPHTQHIREPPHFLAGQVTFWLLLSSFQFLREIPGKPHNKQCEKFHHTECHSQCSVLLAPENKLDIQRSWFDSYEQNYFSWVRKRKGGNVVSFPQKQYPRQIEQLRGKMEHSNLKTMGLQ